MLAKLIKPFHFKVFFSNKFVHAQVLDKVTNVTVASVCSNSRLFEHCRPKNDEAACELAARILAAKAKEKEVPSLYWNGEVAQRTTRRKWDVQVDKMWETLEASGLSVFRDTPTSPQEKNERGRLRNLARKGLGRESHIDPRFRQQMWKLWKRRPRMRTPQPAPVDPRPEI